MIRVGVIGYGYWGPNIVRNLHGLDSTQVEMICDKSPAARNRAKKAYPSVKVVSDPAEILTSTQIDAVAVITPVWTHFELAKKALENGKHVFVEKPFTSSVAQAKELVELGAKKKLIIMVDHTFLFHRGRSERSGSSLRAMLWGICTITIHCVSTWDSFSTM